MEIAAFFIPARRGRKEGFRAPFAPADRSVWDCNSEKTFV